MANRTPLLIGLWVVLGVLWSGSLQAVPRLDSSFGVNGRVAVELGAKTSGHAVLVQPDGKIVMAGSSSQRNALNFSLLRFNPNGILDTSFNGDGTVITSLSTGDDEALALGLLSDGRIVAAGYAHNGKDRDLAIVCYRPDGTLDRRFGDAGVVLVAIGNGNEEITAIAIGRSNLITVVGSTEGTAGRILLAARYLANGEPDLTFGEHGISLIGVGDDASAEGILERVDGSYVISGTYGEKKKSSAMLVGLRPDGMIDPGFGENGVAIPAGTFAASEGYRLAADEDGLLYLVGSIGLPGKRDTALFRFNRQGKADTTYGDRGMVVSRISKEDDVLYDITASRSGVVASGFTTDAGTRQFLLLSYPPDSNSATVPVVSPPKATVTVEEAVSDLPPVEEVRITGSTRVQIRRLQLWTNSIRIEDLQLLGTLAEAADLLGLVGSLAPGGPIAASTVRSALAVANANGMVDRLTAGGGTLLKPGITTTTFSEGESVSFALALDSLGNIVVVGSADGNDASSMVAARFLADDMDDRVADKPGHRSSHITTSPPVEITRTSITAGGEIGAAFGKEVVRRGVVFSVTPGPLYTGQQSAANRSATSLWRPGVDAVAAFFLPEALAAEPTPPSKIKSRNGFQSPAASQAVESGEAPGGTGTGQFVAVMDRLLPGTIYYLRAYAVTASGEVYYGNQVNVRTADACFVATASFGTFLHPAVGILREFRDTFLTNQPIGKRLVDLYYTLSPPVADIIAKSEILRFIVRLLLLPWVGFSWLALHAGIGQATALVAAMVALVGFLVTRGRLGPYQSR